LKSITCFQLTPPAPAGGVKRKKSGLATRDYPSITSSLATPLIVGVHHEEKPAKIPCITMWQYWLGNTKPFRLILNAATEFKKKII